jgi:hypothetical protein
MIRKFCLTLAVISAACITMVSAQQTAKVTASGIGYLEYLPQGYHSNSNKYPVVISLHGIKEKGTSSTDPRLVLRDLERVDNVGLPRYVKTGTRYPFILISPQLKSNHRLWSPSFVMEVLNHVKKNLRIDDRRIYLTGLSLGGFGVWRTAGEYPDVFAAIAPICAGGNALNKADDIAAKNLPVWGFHGSGDKVVSYTVTTRMVNAINTAPRKPNPLAKATIYPGMGHAIWDKAYQQSDVLDWLLRHRKGSSPSGDNDNDNDGSGEHDDGDNDHDDGDNEDEEGDDDGDNGEEDKEGEDNSSNKSPIVNAGSDKIVTLPISSLYIQGTANDPDGKIASYRWQKISGGHAGLTATNNPRLRAYQLRPGSYVFRLTVTDNKGARSSDDVAVVVKKSANDKPPKDNGKKPSSRNSLPIVSAGPDRVLTLPTNSVTIQGSAKDKDGQIVMYEWAKTYGKAARLSGANTSRVRISDLQRGIYIFRLRATDNKGGVKDDYFKITVNDAKKGKVANNNPRNTGNDNKSQLADNRSGRSNSAPYASAGPDRVVKAGGKPLTIQAKAFDRDGKIVSYEWDKTYGNRATLRGAHSSRVTIANMQRGIYIFRLTVKDDDGAVDKDFFKVTVKDSGVAVKQFDRSQNMVASRDANHIDGSLGS